MSSIEHSKKLASRFWLSLVVVNWRKCLLFSLLGALIGLGSSFVVRETFTARVVLIPPQQQQSIAFSAAQTIGAISGLAGGAALRNPADQYISILESRSVSTHVVETFGLKDRYGSATITDALVEVAKRAKFSYGKRDGLMTIEYSDFDPKFSAEVANGYVDELRKATTRLAVTEAQSRRVFFESQMKDVFKKLKYADGNIQEAGLGMSAVKSDPKMAAEVYAKTKSALDDALARLSALKTRLTSSAPEVRAAEASVSYFTKQLSRFERDGKADESGSNYAGAYRGLRYQEALFEVVAKQYELARLDEAKEGAIIQVLDEAVPPEKKTAPRRLLWGLAGGVLGFVLLFLYVARDALMARIFVDERVPV